MNSHWVPGNRITLLENGEAYFPRVFEAIAAAEHEVLLETFILFDDKVGRELQQALLRAAGRGAVVHVLVDGWGSPDLPPSFTQPLLDAGVRLRSFEPAQRLLGARINMLRRMHHKLVVVDGRRAFVGGINYSLDHLAEFGPLAKQDYAVEVEGPLVGQIQAFCRANLDTPQPARHDWLQRWRAIRTWGGALEGVGDGAVAAFVTRDNHLHRTDIERHYRAAVRNARQRVLIANAYFFPGYRLLRDLRRAARRGVQVDHHREAEFLRPVERSVEHLDAARDEGVAVRPVFRVIGVLRTEDPVPHRDAHRVEPAPGDPGKVVAGDEAVPVPAQALGSGGRAELGAPGGLVGRREAFEQAGHHPLFQHQPAAEVDATQLGTGRFHRILQCRELVIRTVSIVAGNRPE